MFESVEETFFTHVTTVYYFGVCAGMAEWEYP